MSNANFGYKGMKKLTSPSRRFNKMQHSKTSEIDQVFNVVIENNPKNIVDLAHTIGAYNPRTAKLFDFLKDKVKIKISYLKSDLEELKTLTKHALGFFVPSRNELYTRLDSQTSLALQERGKELGVGVFDSFKITLVHEAIHGYFNNLPSSEKYLVEGKLKQLARKILDAKIKTDLKYFEHYSRILRNVIADSQSPQEVVTYWFSADDLKEPLQQFNDDIMTILDGSIDNDFEIIEPFIPNYVQKAQKKEPFEMTYQEFKESLMGTGALTSQKNHEILKYNTNHNLTTEQARKFIHEYYIKKAISDKKLVPSEVLAEYPELQQTEQKKQKMEGELNIGDWVGIKLDTYKKNGALDKYYKIRSVKNGLYLLEKQDGESIGVKYNSNQLVKIANLNLKQETNTDTMDNIFEPKIQISDSIGDYDLLTGDAFFKQNPSKVLGKVMPRTNQFGELVDSVQGNIETEIEKIEAPIPEQIQYGAIQTGNSSDTPIETKIEESIKSIESKILTPKATKKKEGLQGDFVNEIISFRESTKLYNKDLTRIEIEAYLSVHPEIKYSLYFDENEYSNTDFINHRVEFPVTSGDGYTRTVKTPLLIPVNDKFEYYAEFLSGDVVSKKKIIDLLKDSIIEKYSETYYNDILKALEMVMPKVKRFNDAVVSNRPVLLCHTKDARNHKITALKNGYEFKESVSLVTGFAYWLRNYYSALEYNGVTFLDIEKYIDNENWYDAPKDAKTDEKKAIDAKNSEAYQRAKGAGDAAFSFFLAEMVLDNELAVIEKQWNERFNRYVYPNLNKIPVGFTHSAKFKDGHNLAFSDVQRNAVAFMKINGSGLIAYGVGVGKSLSALIAISNAIDNGDCKRPLLVVPKATYYKWISETTNTKVYDKETKVEKIITEVFLT
ncbi:MAG: DEAD/DEAH box helicase [Saprospiraceae bacterium]|nr:DEAD/DEAH box helicase [Saprospiraceae bacterium]